MKRYDKHSGEYFSKDEYISAFIGGLPNEDMLGDIWESLPTKYDSEADTLKHIRQVNAFMLMFCQEMMKRAIKHDQSKLFEPEKSKFDELTPKLKDLTYGSEEYKQSLSELGTALTHHYKNNDHHPECYDNGIEDMNLFSIVEMLCDWYAASMRHDNGDIYDSVRKNIARFKIEPQLGSILMNTARFIRNKGFDNVYKP